MNELSAIAEERHVKAVACHRRAMASAGMILESFLDYAAELKSINEQRYYVELGFDSFDSYLREYYDISDKTAYKYIAVYDNRQNLPGDLFSPGRKIEISKLYLLTTVPEEQRAEIAESVDLETVSKSVLERQIKELKEENKRLEEEKQVTFESLEKAEQAETDAYNLMAKERSLKEELKNKLTDVNFERNSLLEKCDELKQKILELEARKPEQITVENTTEIERLRRELSEAQRQLAEKPTAEVIKDDKEAFRFYLVAAADAVKRLCDFVTASADSPNIELFRSKSVELAGMIKNNLEEKSCQ